MSNSGQKGSSEAPVDNRSSNFAQTCNLLSRYVKERGSLKNLNIEIGGKVESLEDIVKPGSSFAASRNKRAKISSSSSSEVEEEEDGYNKNSSIREKSVDDRKPAQLTIFYAGKVLVFDDYPMKKARELVSIAKKSSSQMSYGILPFNLADNSNSNSNSSNAIGLPPRPQSKQPDLAKQFPLAGISSNTLKDKITSNSSAEYCSSSSKGVIGHLVPHQSDANAAADDDVSDLPIARRSSIRRFLEKRKDRASGRMPYNIQHEQLGSSSAASEWKDDDGGIIDLNL